MVIDNTSLDYMEVSIVNINIALERFLKGKIKSIRVYNVSPSVFEQYYDLNIFDTNGRDFDFWGEITFNNETIPVSGSAYYGYINIEHEEDWEDEK